ncbi:MAG: ABC transporter substrate-binding protein [Hyphomicrobiaceae bacterium]|nr:ABC transporter substrate-binding protein [Hyphomicrobiaceae bacterium]
MPLRLVSLAMLYVLVAAFSFTSAIPARAINDAEAAKGPPVTIAILFSSRTDVCHDTGELAAIKRLVERERERINARGGIAGRPLDVRILDDERDDARTIANVRTALAEPNLLAMVGLSSSSRAKLVFDTLGKKIGESAVPFLSEISVSSIFAAYRNVFTTRPSQDEERIPVMAAFTRSYGYSRPAYVGIAGSVFSTALGDGLNTLLGPETIVADQRLSAREGKLDGPAIATAVGNIAAKNPDLIFLGVGSRNTPEIIKQLVASQTTPALFVTGRIEQLPADVVNSYPNAIYQLAWDGLPEAFNNRMRKLIAIERDSDWLFEGTPIRSSPGWANGACKERPEDADPDPLESANLRAIGRGAQYADMVALIARATRDAERTTDLSDLRRIVTTHISRDYAAGRGTFKGTFQNWSFDPVSRTAARSPMVVILPRGLGRTQLAPIQFLKSRDGRFTKASTLYLDVDLIKAHRVDDNEKTFFAEFYLSMRANEGATLDKIEFANAYLDPRTNGRQITIEVVHGGGASDTYPATMRIYKVSGRFLFEPRLAAYPFDQQLFAIELQPKSGDRPFIIQPPPFDLRDSSVISDSWEPVTQYVGYDEDFVPVVDAYTLEPSVVPFYKASFAWIMKRETTDYFLRVVVPLAFILIVAYLSIFIPRSHFEAIVTIQVTALLSAVALYLSLPQLDSDTATLSDRLFVFDYMMVSLMIAISIMRVNPHIASRKWLTGALDLIHVAAIPALVALAGFYVYRLSAALP